MRFQTATQWGVYQVEVEDGRVQGVFGHHADPDPSPIGQGLLDAATHKLRVQRPSIRRGWLTQTDRARQHRGVDEFVEVPWDEALELAGNEIRRVIQTFGNTAIYAGSYGWASAGRFHHAQSQLHRFLNLIGGATRAMNSYSTAAAQVILPHVVAPWHQIELCQAHWPAIAKHTELMVAFGGVPLRNTQVAYGGITEHQSGPGLQQAIAAGMQLVNVSASRDDVPEWSNAHWLACRPGTDVALMLGLAYVLENEDLLARDFLTSHCVGYDTFRRYLVGAEDGVAKDPRWASNICGIDAQEIVSLARQLPRHRTFLTAAWSLQRADHGEQPYWMLITLAAMLGQIGMEGGGFGFGYGAEGFIGSPWRRFHWATFPKGPNPTRFAIPVARITELLERPGEHLDYNGQQIELPHTELIYWAGGNPFHHHQDLNKFGESMAQARTTVIVNEPWWTPIAQWADIVYSGDHDSARA